MHKGLILFRKRSLKANIPGQIRQLHEVNRPLCCFCFSVLPHVASLARVNSWNKMAAGPPAVASTFQGVERKKQGDVREVPLPFGGDLPEFPLFYGHLFGRISHEGLEAGKGWKRQSFS